MHLPSPFGHLLRALDAPPPAANADLAARRSPTATSAYALIADLDRATCALLASRVTTRGLTPVVVHDGAAALATLAERGAPQLSIVNIALPSVDGFWILCALRSLATATQAPVVVIADNIVQHRRALDLKHALGIGAIASKPHVVATLERQIESLLEVEIEPPAEAVLQILLASTAKRFGVATVVLSFGSRERQTTLHHGPVGELLATARPFAVRPDADELVVENAFENSIYARHPLVRAGHVGSCVRVPLIAGTGKVFGTLTVADPGPWLGSPYMVEALRVEARGLAGVVCGDPAPRRASTTDEHAVVPAPHHRASACPQPVRATSRANRHVVRRA